MRILIVPVKRAAIEKALNTAKLVKKPVMVSRGGKTYQTMRWVKPWEEKPEERGAKQEDPKSKRKPKAPDVASGRGGGTETIQAGATVSFNHSGKEMQGTVSTSDSNMAVVQGSDGRKYGVAWGDINWHKPTEATKQKELPMDAAAPDDQGEDADVQWLLDGNREDNQKKIDKSLLVQPSGDLDSLYKLAEEGRAGFKEFMDKAKDELGAKKLLSRPVLKSKERILEKMKEDGAKDASQIYDIDGHTLVFDDLAGVAKALKYFMAQGGSVRIKNNYAKPSPAGYRDININFKLPNGMISEVQINTESMMEAKEGAGHVFYEVMREALGSVPPPPPPPPYGDVMEAQKAFYNFAWENSQRPRSDANLKASLLEIARPFWNKSAKSLEGRDSSWLSDKTKKRFMEFGSQANGTSSFSKNSSPSVSKSILGILVASHKKYISRRA